MSQVKDIAVKCFRDEAQAILDLIPQLDEHFDAAVDLMLRCTGNYNGSGQKRAYRCQDGRYVGEYGDTGFFHQSAGCLPWRLGGDDT